MNLKLVSYNIDDFTEQYKSRWYESDKEMVEEINIDLYHFVEYTKKSDQELKIESASLIWNTLEVKKNKVTIEELKELEVGKIINLIGNLGNYALYLIKEEEVYITDETILKEIRFQLSEKYIDESDNCIRFSNTLAEKLISDNEDDEEILRLEERIENLLEANFKRVLECNDRSDCDIYYYDEKYYFESVSELKKYFMIGE